MKNNKSVGLEVSELVQEVLNTISPPYPENVTYLVCLAIKENNAWYARYKHLVESYSKWSVNCQIGRSTRQITGLRNLGSHVRVANLFIKTYTRLG